MKKIFIYSSIILVSLLFFKKTTASKTEKTPDGYVWVKLREINGSLLKPKKWYFQKSISRQKIVYRITKHRPKYRCFFTGLTLNIIKDTSKKANLNAELYAAYYIYNYMKKSISVIDKWSSTKGIFSYYCCDVIKKLKEIDNKTLFRVRVTALANKKTDTLYIFIFGSPQDEWDCESNTEKIILDYVLLDQNF